MRLLNDGTNELDDFHNSFNGFDRPRRRRRKPMPRPKVKYTMYDYIAERSPADSHILINKFGKYRRARNPEELAYQLKDFVRTFGDKGLIELSKIHPDRDLIELECRGCKEQKRKKPEVREKVVYSNADGNSGNNNTQSSDSKMLVFGGLMMVAFAILTIKK
jgi:hypothetical protein